MLEWFLDAPDLEHTARLTRRTANFCKIVVFENVANLELFRAPGSEPGHQIWSQMVSKSFKIGPSNEVGRPEAHEPAKWTPQDARTPEAR